MTPVSDLRRMSSSARVRPDVTQRYGSGQHPDDDDLDEGDEDVTDHRPVVLRPLQLDNADSGCLLQRRLSRSANPSSRSYSIRTIKKYAEGRHRASIPGESGSGVQVVKVKERAVSNRSLPLPGDETEYMRLRNFSVTSKGVVNRGDSFRSKLANHVRVFGKGPKEVPVEDGAVICCVDEALPLKSESERTVEERQQPCRVLLVGAPGVGKTALKNQFMTSEYICASGYSQDDEMERIITVNLNNVESEMEFEEETLQEENSYKIRMEVDAYVIVYSVTHRKSYLQARHLLAAIEGLMDVKAVILVGNKTDLARLRAVTTDEGKSLAKEMGCKFIETSVAINHQVDELLVGTLTQVRMKTKMADKMRKKRESQPTQRRSSIYTGSKASGVLKKILKRACLKSKSCDNLHVL